MQQGNDGNELAQPPTLTAGSLVVATAMSVTQKGVQAQHTS